jgi:hypothetical protein
MFPEPDSHTENDNAANADLFPHGFARSHARGTNYVHESWPHALSTAVRVMPDSKTFRLYADECRRLARAMPAHKDKLLEMAEAWMACAEAAEKTRTAGKENPGALQ